MSDSFFDKFIADLVKGANTNSRENGGPGVNIIVARENHGCEEKLASEKLGTIADAYANGATAAAAAFGVKEAFLPALLPLAGSLLGGTALRAGAGAVAKGAMGRGAAGLASKVVPKMTGGIGGAATDMAGSMVGGAIGNKLAPQPQQQPQ